MDTPLNDNQTKTYELMDNNNEGQIFESKETIEKNGISYDVYTKKQFIENQRHW